jgi:hypothetical protein
MNFPTESPAVLAPRWEGLERPMCEKITSRKKVPDFAPWGVLCRALIPECIETMRMRVRCKSGCREQVTPVGLRLVIAIFPALTKKILKTMTSEDDRSLFPIRLQMRGGFEKLPDGRHQVAFVCETLAEYLQMPGGLPSLANRELILVFRQLPGRFGENEGDDVQIGPLNWEWLAWSYLS